MDRKNRRKRGMWCVLSLLYSLLYSLLLFKLFCNPPYNFLVYLIQLSCIPPCNFHVYPMQLSCIPPYNFLVYPHATFRKGNGTAVRQQTDTEKIQAYAGLLVWCNFRLYMDTLDTVCYSRILSKAQKNQRIHRESLALSLTQKERFELSRRLPGLHP